MDHEDLVRKFSRDGIQILVKMEFRVRPRGHGRGRDREDATTEELR